MTDFDANNEKKKDLKNLTKKTIKTFSEKHTSDIEFLMEVFFHWFDSGIVVDSVCVVCDRKISKKEFAEHKGCLNCRRDFANLNLINPKIMEEILYSKDKVMKILNDNLPRQVIKDKNISFADILGHCLASSFPEKIGSILIQANQKNSIIFKNIENSCKIGDTSIFFDKKMQNNRKVIAMKITKLPNGTFLADQIHPLKEDWNLKNKKINYEQIITPNPLPKKYKEKTESDIFILEKFNENIDEILNLPKETQRLIFDDFLLQILQKHVRDKSLINIIADRLQQFSTFDIEDIIQYTKNNSAMLQRIREAEEWIHNL